MELTTGVLQVNDSKYLDLCNLICTSDLISIPPSTMVWVRERIIPTEQPPLVGEVIANFLWIDSATWSAWRIPTAVFSVF
jgi:hypothetical protein